MAADPFRMAVRAEELDGQPYLALLVEPTIGQMEANARLIAAAPELLQACRDVLKCPPRERHSIDLELMLEEIIAKATGEGQG
jgi:hypothetical protein